MATNEALKLDPNYAKFVERFIKEGRLLAKLGTEPHPHIVRVTDLFEEGDTPCLVMDFIPGESEEFVNRLDQVFQSQGISIVRDKRDLGYKGLIKEFMERIGRGKCVIVVISDRYLKSPNCMMNEYPHSRYSQ